ncbi:MAG: hypothetical protein ACRCU0_01815 [Candidatus Rhabdochlamydia sp.]
MKKRSYFHSKLYLGSIVAFNITILNPYGEIMKEHNKHNHHPHQPNKPHGPHHKPNPCGPCGPCHKPHNKPGCGC